MTKQAPVQPGGIVRVLCDTTDGQRVTADVTAESVDLLGCSCWRVRTTRPGPDGGPYSRTMELIFQECSRIHDDGPAPVVVRYGAQATR